MPYWTANLSAETGTITVEFSAMSSAGGSLVKGLESGMDSGVLRSKRGPVIVTKSGLKSGSREFSLNKRFYTKF